MTTQDQIDTYIAGLAPARRGAVQTLHDRILALCGGARLWFLDGRNAEGKVVTNPNIGYGAYTLRYADGSTRDFYRIGLSANTTGVSVYVMGIADKTYLARTYGAALGKASITGYCIKFRKLEDIDLAVLEGLIARRLTSEELQELPAGAGSAIGA